MAKTPPASAGDGRSVDSIPGWEGSPGGGHSNPLQLFLPGKSHVQRRLVGYSPWGCRVDAKRRGKLRKNAFVENDDKSVS